MADAKAVKEKTPNIKPSPAKEIKRYCIIYPTLQTKSTETFENISSICKEEGGVCTKWKDAKSGKCFIPVYFDGNKEIWTLAKSLEKKLKIGGIEANVAPLSKQSNSPHGKHSVTSSVEAPAVQSPPCEVSNPLKEDNSLNSASPMPEDLALQILWSMRKYGQSKKPENWKQFAVILVLPELEYNNAINATTKLLSESLLDKYARTAVPSSCVSSMDHCEDEHKSVMHAEVKLVGDPKRHPSRLAVPYDRSCLVQLITEYRKSEWLNGTSVDEFAKSFKVLLYSEEVVCKYCLDAIFDSVFYNLVQKGFSSTGEYIPVIGYNFSKGDITSRTQERLHFYGPRSTLPGNAKHSDSPVAAKRNLNEDLENVPKQARTPVKEGGKRKRYSD